ncbi:DUF6194 family protein [Chitinophaga sp. XS-30]|uniref:DUF6194 family protein n=1 Tax=Chitinophaga sp. XS-30 TaxID=2604421 RepID=UPI0011DDBF17|nr:DUF6194 family protein [Chitinophaga sp. XS-30]QEH43808.1 hypothetical protein FW415_24385 [Chitinophaga sp. XS-30]
MSIEEIKTHIFQNFEHVNIVEANGDLFFMYDNNDKFPFATIVTSDNEYDSTSNLNREGFFRLNVGLDGETFNSMFGGLTSEKGLEAYLNLGIDFTKEDTILPHPTYGAMYWVCVVNPSKETFESVKEYLALSYNKVAKKQ